MSNYADWRRRGRGTCGIYEIYDELSGRRYIGSSTHCQYRLELHRMRINRGSSKLPSGVQRLAYTGQPVLLSYRVLKAVPECDLAMEEGKAIAKAGDKATNVQRSVSRRW